MRTSPLLPLIKGVEPTYLDTKTKFNQMMTKWNTLKAKQAALANELGDPNATQNERCLAMNEYTQAAADCVTATSEFSSSFENLMNLLNSNAVKHDLGRFGNLTEYLGELSGTVTNALSKVESVTSAVSDAFSAMDAAQEHWGNIAAIYAEMYSHLLEDSAHIFEPLLPAQQHQAEWVAGFIYQYYAGQGVQVPQELWECGHYMDFPFKLRNELFIHWFYNENMGEMAMPSIAYFRDFDVVFWSQLEVGWLGFKAYCSLIFPAAGKIDAAMDALKNIEYILDPTENLPTN